MSLATWQPVSSGSAGGTLRSRRIAEPAGRVAAAPGSASSRVAGGGVASQLKGRGIAHAWLCLLHQCLGRRPPPVPSMAVSAVKARAIGEAAGAVAVGLGGRVAKRPKA